MSTDPVTVPVELTLPPPSDRPPKSAEELAHLAARFAFVCACFAMADTNIVPITVIGNHIKTAIGTTAILTGHPQIVLTAFWLSLLLSMPFLITQFSPFHRPKNEWLIRWHRFTIRWQMTFRRIAMLGYLIGGIAWCVLAWRSWGLDIGNYNLALWSHTIINLAFARILASSINHELLRQIYWSGE